MREKIFWATVGALIALVLVGVFWLGKIYGSKNNPLPVKPDTDEKVSVGQSGAVSIEKPVPAANSAPPGTSSAGDSQTPPTVTKFKPDGWLTYLVKNQDYKFSYPTDATIEQPDSSDFDPESVPPEGSCVTIKLPNGYVTIYGKNNDPNMAGFCLGTGLGAEWGPGEKIDVEVFGKRYTVKGMETSSASAGYRQEQYIVNADSGERIKFGIQVNEKYAPEVKYEDAKAKVLSVLKTLERS